MYRRIYSNVERKWLAWRLGSVNVMFDHCMAVDYYHLDLSNAEERVVVEELVHTDKSIMVVIVSINDIRHTGKACSC